MVAIQVRDVSEADRDALAAEAEYRGLSLQMLLHEVIERQAASARNVAWVREQRKQPRSGVAGPSSRDLIEAGRRERDRAILDAVGLDDVPVFD